MKLSSNFQWGIIAGLTVAWAFVTVVSVGSLLLWIILR